MTDESLFPAPARRRPWSLLPSALVGLVSALIPAVSLRALGAPLWASFLAGALVFPLLPLGWHLLAERGAVLPPGDEPRAGALTRLGLRALALALLVLAVSLSNLGPAKVGKSLLALVGRKGADQTMPAPPPGPGGLPRRHELEAFIPADARAVLAVSEPAVMRQLLAAAGADTQEKLAALAKCQIHIEQGRLLIAARDRASRLIVVRAPGVTDARNLYCLAGFLGSDRLRLRFTSDKAPVRFEVEGLFPRALQFTATDDRTIVASDGGWGLGGDRKLFTGPDNKAEGELGAVLARVDRGASLWSASVFGSGSGPWDLALDARVEDSHLRLRGSSIPPAGPANRAVVDTTIPLSFASALPVGALTTAVTALAEASGAWPSLDTSAPAPARPAPPAAGPETAVPPGPAPGKP